VSATALRIIDTATETSDSRSVLRRLSDDLMRKLDTSEARTAFSTLLVGAQEAERRRISQELHDSLCQRLAVLGLLAARLDSPEQPEQTRSIAGALHAGLADLGRDLRGIAHGLHPGLSERLGLEQALRHTCRCVEQASGLRIHFVAKGLTREIAAPIALCLHRVTQEALANSTKHANAGCCMVVAVGGRTAIRLVVRDNGKGFDALSKPSPGLGLVTMRERVQMVGGRITIQVVGVAGNGRDVLALVESHHPDVVVMDISMPALNGIETARLLLRDNPRLKIILLTMHTTPDYVLEAFRAGVSGYVLKQSSPQELETAIRQVLQGNSYISPLVTREALVMVSTPGEIAPTAPLTLRQREVLQLAAEGYTAKEIASFLNVSPKTVDFHKNRIMRRLGVHSTTELARYAVKNGYIEA
jgi:DNA-binding NarL/FixJ family response regulator